MLTLLRRYLVLAALFFWQGGFTFYAAVVVPVGQHVLDSHRKQGFITREVTQYLNLAGAVALVPLAWDAAATGCGSGRRRLGRWLAWGGMALTLVLLVWLHQQLDALLDFQGRTLLDGRRFRLDHRIYLWVSTVQWACALVYLALTLQSWRTEDRPTNRVEYPEGAG